MTGSATSSFILVVLTPRIIRVLLFDPRHQETRKNQVGYLQDRTPRYIFIGIHATSYKADLDFTALVARLHGSIGTKQTIV